MCSSPQIKVVVSSASCEHTKYTMQPFPPVSKTILFHLKTPSIPSLPSLHLNNHLYKHKLLYMFHQTTFRDVLVTLDKIGKIQSGALHF